MDTNELTVIDFDKQIGGMRRERPRPLKHRLQWLVAPHMTNDGSIQCQHMHIERLPETALSQNAQQYVWQYQRTQGITDGTNNVVGLQVDMT